MIKLTDILLETLMEKKLCPKGRAYYNRRIAAGEKPSAYLSGRAVKVCKGLMSEDIDPSEAYNDVDAIATLANKKRDVAFIVRKSNTPENWERVQQVIKDNNIKTVYVKGNPYDAYVAYLPGSENKATQLKDLAEKYGGYLASNATAEDARKIGKLLGYKEDKIEQYIKDRNIDESLRDWFKKEDDLKEAKQVGIIYHYTMLDRLKNIIESNTLESSYPEDTGSTHKDYSGPAISFTRTKYKPQSIVTNESDAALVIDGNKLSNNYKLIPFQDSEIPDDEMEERIYNKDITNLDKYIIKVILYESNPEIESLLKEKNIPYELNLDESLRDWFKKEDWVRIDTQGNITGPCGTMKKGKATTRCLPRAKANSLTKAERAATARKKVAGSKKGKQFVPNTEKAKVKFNK